MGPERLFSQALQDPSREAKLDPRDAILAAHRFLSQCRDYARDREIPALLARCQVEPTPLHAAKLHQWTSWVAFVEHAMRELEAGTLDRWFLPAPPQEDP